MKKLSLLFLSMIFGSLIIFAQEINTAEIHEAVVSLKTVSNKQSYLIRTFKSDQNNRRNGDDQSIDFKNLIAMSDYVNEHGYPKKELLGRASGAPRLVWIHSHLELKKVTFPIIYQGFLAGEITEEDVRTYYLRNLYKEKMDDKNYETIALEELYRICEVNTSDKISIDDILKTQQVIDDFNQMEVLEMTSWESPTVVDSSLLNSNYVERKKLGKSFELIKKVNGKSYIQRYSDQIAKASELEELAPNKYKIKGSQTDNFYEFQGDKILLRTDAEVINEFYIKND